MKKLFAIAVTLTFLLCGMAVNAQEAETADGLHASIQPVTDSPEWVTNLPAAQEADQLFIVAAMGMDKTTAYITMHRKDDTGAVRLAFNTCQSCGGSPYAWFEYLGNNTRSIIRIQEETVNAITLP